MTRKNYYDFLNFILKYFSTIDVIASKMQLDVYIIDLWSSIEFSRLKEIDELARTILKTKKGKIYPLVYLLVSLALILSVLHHRFVVW